MTEGLLYCEKHPHRETSLRCNRCEKLICSECAVHTPVGYRCQECVRSQQSIFDTARNFDYPIAFVTAMVGVGVGIYLVSFLGFWGFFLAPVIGGGTAEVIGRLIRRRRSRRLPLVAVIGGVIGSIPHFFQVLYSIFATLIVGLDLTGLGAIAISALWPIAYGFLIISTMYYRIRGIRL